MRRGRSGFLFQAPELAEYVDSYTECRSQDPSYYVEILNEHGERRGCLVFYGPELKPAGLDLKVGAALEPEGWKFTRFVDYIWVRRLVLETAFMTLGADHISAYVKPANVRSIRMMELCKFVFVENVVLNGVQCRYYRLEG